jgi:hypothetical protein
MVAGDYPYMARYIVLAKAGCQLLLWRHQVFADRSVGYDEKPEVGRDYNLNVDWIMASDRPHHRCPDFYISENKGFIEYRNRLPQVPTSLPSCLPT